MKTINLKNNYPYINEYKGQQILFLGNGINLYKTQYPTFLYVPLKFQKEIPSIYREKSSWYKNEKQLIPLYFLNKYLETNKFKDSISLIDLQKEFPIESTKYLLSLGYNEDKILNTCYNVFSRVSNNSFETFKQLVYS